MALKFTKLIFSNKTHLNYLNKHNITVKFLLAELKIQQQIRLSKNILKSTKDDIIFKYFSHKSFASVNSSHHIKTLRKMPQQMLIHYWQRALNLHVRTSRDSKDSACPFFCHFMNI